MISVYEVTGDYDVIAIGKFKDTDDMNGEIKSLITDPDINQSNTSIVLNAVSENEQFELDTGNRVSVLELLSELDSNCGRPVSARSVTTARA